MWYAAAAMGNGHQHSSVSRDVNSVKAQINGILHEDSLPFYDQVPHPIVIARQTSAPVSQSTIQGLHSHTASPRGGRLSHGSRLQTQGSQVDLGDLGVSSPTGMSRANSRDTGHIATQAPTQYASGSWQGRLSKISVEQQQPYGARQNRPAQPSTAQRSSAQQGSAYASLEAMLSSIPESLSGMPSMPSMPSVPSMSDIEKSMQSGWSSFTGSLGLSSARTQQAAAAPAGWVAFADNSAAVADPAQAGTASSSNPSFHTASPDMHAAEQQPASPASMQSLQSRLSMAALDVDRSSTCGHALLSSPCKKLTGLQSIDPLAAAKEAASVPLRAMSSFRQESPSAVSSQQTHPAALTAQASMRGSSAAQDANVPLMDPSPSSNWSDFTSATTAEVAAVTMQPLPRDVLQPASTAQPQPVTAASTDLWAQWSMPSSAQTEVICIASDRPQHESKAVLPTAASADQFSLLDT